ncbi:MAG: MBL fold metallo-hydrolase RNA specificity domain-containing protein [Candidatus Jordarchaeum sp.]|uniref:MBL fold metallo-hydrolase RNA specificity domain-containing protein n=1 Tax=Candidatus Jordarchaeum sp. TaxID=2823881 RepID=UPI00404A2431
MTRIELSFLGGSREVGRSCISIKKKDKLILLDAGISLGRVKGEEYPLEPSNPPNAVFVTHAHLDHSGYLPAIISKYGCPEFSTSPTQDLAELLHTDFLKLQKDWNIEPPYTSEEVMAVRSHAEDINYMVEITIRGGIKAMLLPSGHILGAAMIRLEVDNHIILYTGDLSTRNTRTQDMAETSVGKVDTLIIESTYAAQNDRHPSFQKVERSLIDSINKALDRGGRVLVPVFAVGRAQEVMLSLEAYIRSGALKQVPIYIDGMIKKVNEVYRLYWSYLRPTIRRQIRYTRQSPLESDIFVEVNQKRSVNIDEPCIIVSTSGMLEGGPVIGYIKKIAGDPKSLICLTGYQVPGTRGRRLQDGEREIKIAPKEESIKVNSEVKSFEFSAHADQSGLFRFISKIKELERVYCVHGEEWKTVEFAERIEKLKKVDSYSPINGETYLI